MSDDGVTDVQLIAAALQGESTYWFAMPRGGKPLPEKWGSANCFWLYPVEDDLTQFTSVKGFRPTDAVYELDASGVSKVLPSAALKDDVMARRYQKGRRTYFFIPAEEVDWVEREYKAMLKKEADRPFAEQIAKLPMTRRVAAQRYPSAAGTVEETGNEAQALPFATDADPEVETRSEEGTAATSEATSSTAVASYRWTGGGDGGSSRQRARSANPNSHKRREPHRGTTVYVAPTNTLATGQHRSNEAFRWPVHYIVHRGSIDYLCPDRTGNTYGFRLDKVTHNGFPVFLLFGSSVNNSEEVSPNATGVAALESAVVHGEGGNGSMGNTVMILTRPPGEKHRSYPAESGSALGRRGTAVAATVAGTAARRRRRARSEEDEMPSSSSSEMEDSDSDVDLDEGETETGEDDDDSITVRRRSSRAVRKAAKASATRQPMTQRTKRERPALQAASVNTWTDLERAVPDVAELSSQFPFTHDTSAPLHTTVFPDGTCVTCSTASAERARRGAGKVTGASGNGNGSGGSGSSGGAAPRLGGNNPDDDAIRNLLEHVQLAQLQCKAASNSS